MYVTLKSWEKPVYWTATVMSRTQATWKARVRVWATPAPVPLASALFPEKTFVQYVSVLSVIIYLDRGLVFRNRWFQKTLPG